MCACVVCIIYTYTSAHRYIQAYIHTYMHTGIKMRAICTDVCRYTGIQRNSHDPIRLDTRSHIDTHVQMHASVYKP